MWPVGYILASSYSPFRVEKQLPRRDWRDAFEDLLALESGGDIISDESRKQETLTAANLGWERAKFCIERYSGLNIRDARTLEKAQTALDDVKSSRRRAPPSVLPWLDQKIKDIGESAARRIARAHSFKTYAELRRDWPASRRKDRGQWMASLITSGALRGWTSVLADSASGDVYYLKKQGTERKDRESVGFSEHELCDVFDHGAPLASSIPDPPTYWVANPTPARLPTDLQVLDEDSWGPPPPDRPALVRSKTPDRPYFKRQSTSAERITLSSGKTAMRVVMENRLTNGDVEKKVMVEEPCKVLQEVEKAKALIQDRRHGWIQ